MLYFKNNCHFFDLNPSDWQCVCSLEGKFVIAGSREDNAPCDIEQFVEIKE